MKHITLICTNHRERGLCNKNELLNILLAIGPDVIFEELRPADHELLYCDMSKHTLEMRAITSYLNRRKAQQVPIDDYEFPEDFREKIFALDSFVESRSPEYCEIFERLNHLKGELGFGFLNSDEFVALARESEQVYGNVVFRHGNDLAKKMLEMWNDQLRKRETSMLDNIFAFSRENDFKSGAFLVGAGHMPGIAAGIEMRIKDQPSVIEWHLWNRP